MLKLCSAPEMMIHHIVGILRTRLATIAIGSCSAAVPE
jgi:hypothetical protein